MRIAFLIVLASIAAPSRSQTPEDEAHRADRLRTEALNRRSPTGYASSRSGGVSPDDLIEYRRAQADYRQRMAEWRERVAACNAGSVGACGD